MKYCKLDDYPLSTHTWRNFRGSSKQLECTRCGEVIVKTRIPMFIESIQSPNFKVSFQSPYSKEIFPTPELETCSARMMRKALG